MKRHACTARGRVPRGSRGFTLIEIVVALAVIGLILGVTVSQMDRMLEWEMKKASTKLAATIRYLYNKAAMEKLYIRLIFDFEEQTYWVEATADPFVITREETRKGTAKKEEKKEGEQKEEQKEEPKEEAAAEGGEGETLPEGEQPKLKVPEPKFGQVDSYLLRPTKLPETVFLKDLQVEHLRGPAEGGKESIYFFPNGYVERAILNLRDENDEVHYSLRTHPISGRVDIEAEYRTLDQSGGRP